MKLVIQRVTSASVTVDQTTIGAVGSGYVVLAAIGAHDTNQSVDAMAAKLINLRIMPDEQAKMNQSIVDVQGELLLIPQFTLYADTKGNRPGFTQAAAPNKAKKLFEHFVAKIGESGLKTATGSFGAHMQVELVNDGPVTIILKN